MTDSAGLGERKHRRDRGEEGVTETIWARFRGKTERGGGTKEDTEHYGSRPWSIREGGEIDNDREKRPTSAPGIRRGRPHTKGKGTVKERIIKEELSSGRK